MSDVVLCGVGGQGTILASRLISRAAMDRGLPVRAAETIGMAQRGGSVMSHVRVGAGTSSPLVGRARADLIVGFEPAEAARQLFYLRPGGIVVVSDRPVAPAGVAAGGPTYDVRAILAYLRESVGGLVVVDAVAAMRALGSARVLNTVLLGAAARAGALGLSEGDLSRAVGELMPERLWGLNRRALAFAGPSAARNLSDKR